MGGGNADLLCEVRSKVSCIQDAIQSISQKQEQLSTSAIRVKSNTHAALSRQLEALRNREVWLLDQVDVILRIQDELLQKHLVSLMQDLGALQQYLDIAERWGEEGMTSPDRIAEVLERIEQLDLQPVENAALNFSADMISLRRAIHDFGEISAKRPRMSEDFDVGLSKKDDKTSLQQPSYNPADWLSKDGIASWANQEEDDYVMLEDSQSEDVEVISTGSEVAEPAPTFGFFQELLNSPISDWLFDRDCMQHQFTMEMSYFKEVSQDIKSWLADYEQKVEEQEDLAEEPSSPKPTCACVAMETKPQLFEIENLDALLCMQDAAPSSTGPKQSTLSTHHWLATGKEGFQEEKEMDMQEQEKTWWLRRPQAEVREVCRANEPCADFSECVSEENCCHAQTFWLASKARSCQNTVGDDSQSVESTHMDLGLYHPKGHSDWLASDDIPANQMSYSVENHMVQQSCIESDWLVLDAPNKGSMPIGGSRGYFDHLSKGVSDWLVEDRPCLETNHMSTLKEYFKQRSESQSDWLAEDRPCLGTNHMSPLQEYFKQRSETQSDWLVEDHPCSQTNHVSPLKEYFKQRSENQSDWLVEDHPCFQTNHMSPLMECFKQRSETQSDWLVEAKKPSECLKSDSNLNAFSTSSSSQWLHGQNDHCPQKTPKQTSSDMFLESRSNTVSDWLSSNKFKLVTESPANEQSILSSYFAERSEETCHWLVEEMKSSKSSQKSSHCTAIEENHKWLSVQDPEEKSLDNFPHLSKQPTSSDSYSNWLSIKPALKYPENLEKSPETHPQILDNKACIDEMTKWLARCTLTANKVEGDITEKPMPWVTTSPGHPSSEPAPLFPCFHEKMELIRWLEV